MTIIGCRSPDRGDDRAGILVAERLGQEGFEAEIHIGDPLTLIDGCCSAQDVIVVDAVITGAPAARCMCGMAHHHEFFAKRRYPAMGWILARQSSWQKFSDDSPRGYDSMESRPADLIQDPLSLLRSSAR